MAAVPADTRSELGDMLNVIEIYDEQLGHWYQYAGLVLLHAIWVYRQHVLPFRSAAADALPTSAGSASSPPQRPPAAVAARPPPTSVSVPVLLAGVLHGVNLMFSFVEGRFAVPGLVVFILFVAVGVWKRHRLRHDPVFLFVAATGVTSTLLMIVYGSWQGGFPEFGDAGLT